MIMKDVRMTEVMIDDHGPDEDDDDNDDDE